MLTVVCVFVFGCVCVWPLRFGDGEQFKDPDLYSDKSDRENEQEENEWDKSEESDSDTSERPDDSYADPEPGENLRETVYLQQSHEELGEVRIYVLV